MRVDPDISGESQMRTFTAVIERCPDTGLYVGYVPGLPGAHSQGETIEELNHNLVEVIGMLLEDGEPALESEFIGTQTVQVG
jgi:predicted RNase H-like HicB family nuclease